MNLVLDFETTKIPIFRPWHPGAYPVSLSAKWLDDGTEKEWVFNHSELREQPTQHIQVAEIQKEIDKADRLIAQNMKFDIQWLWKMGINTSGKKLYCTQVADYLINGQRRIGYHLDDIAERYNLGQKESAVKKFWTAGFETSDIPLSILLPYGMQDVRLTGDIYHRQVPRIIEHKLERLVTLQFEMMNVLARMEYDGFLFDLVRAEQTYTELLEKVALYETELKIQFGVEDLNLNSNQDLSVVLFGGVLKRVASVEVEVEKMVEEKESFLFHYKDPKKEPVVKWRKIKKPVMVKTVKKEQQDIPIKGMFDVDNPDDKAYLSVSKNQLACLKPKNKQQELVLNLLKELSNVSKAAETLRGKAKDAGLINKAGLDSIIHPSFNQTVAATGRLSSSNPNGQNLPRAGTSPIKCLIIPRYGLIGNGDVSQVEWRAAIWQSQDPVGMAEILGGVDQHRENAIEFFQANDSLASDDHEFKPIRTTAKVFTFRLLYGGSAYGMYMDNTMPRYSKTKWKEIVEAYQEKYAVLTAWQEANIDKVHKTGGWLQIPSGRLFYFPRSAQPDWNGYYYEQAAIKNYPTQGFATGDISPLLMVIMKRKMDKLRLKSVMILNVHDSIVFDMFPEERDIIADLYVKTCEDLPKHLKDFFGINFNLPLSGDFECGPNYGELERIR